MKRQFGMMQEATGIMESMIGSGKQQILFGEHAGKQATRIGVAPGFMRSFLRLEDGTKIELVNSEFVSVEDIERCRERQQRLGL